MRTILFLSLLFPVAVNAQFKRSATELAKENIREYLTGKLFENRPYQSLSYGDLTPLKGNDPEIGSYIKHQFAITETQIHGNQKDSVLRAYQFIFYFDNRMRVLRAESLNSE
jgi:hypothetical protein